MHISTPLCPTSFFDFKIHTEKKILWLFVKDFARRINWTCKKKYSVSLHKFTFSYRLNNFINLLWNAYVFFPDSWQNEENLVFHHFFLNSMWSSIFICHFFCSLVSRCRSFLCLDTNNKLTIQYTQFAEYFFFEVVVGDILLFKFVLIPSIHFNHKKN